MVALCTIVLKHYFAQQWELLLLCVVPCTSCYALPIIVHAYMHICIYAVREHRVAENSVLTLEHGHYIGYILQSHVLQSSVFACITLALLYIGMIGESVTLPTSSILCLILYFGWLE